MLNPFIFGRPVTGKEFINRKSSLQSIYNRLIQGESSAIVGEPHIGKTSLLWELNQFRRKNYE